MRCRPTARGQRRAEACETRAGVDPRENALNAWRLVLATSVIFGHFFTLVGYQLSSPTIRSFRGCGGIDGFFALSGFLITASWLHPHLRDYLVALYESSRFLCLRRRHRIRHRPDWSCDTRRLRHETSFVHRADRVRPDEQRGGDAQGRCRRNSKRGPLSADLEQFAVTLMFELGCYFAVAAIGVAGLANRRFLIEKPAQNLRSRLKRKWPVRELAEVGELPDPAQSPDPPPTAAPSTPPRSH